DKDHMAGVGHFRVDPQLFQGGFYPKAVVTGEDKTGGVQQQGLGGERGEILPQRDHLSGGLGVIQPQFTGEGLPHGVQRRHHGIGGGRAAVDAAHPAQLGGREAVGQQKGGLSGGGKGFV